MADLTVPATGLKAQEKEILINLSDHDKRTVVLSSFLQERFFLSLVTGGFLSRQKRK